MNNRQTLVLLDALIVVALLLAGCGKSSSSTSTSSSTSQSAETTSIASTAPSTTAPTPTSSTSSLSTVTVTPATATALLAIGTAGGVTATLHAGTHTPTVGRPWPLHLTVTRGGTLAKASVAYEYLFGGQVVAHRSHYIFTGHFSDVFQWPSSAVGYPLTFRAVIVSDGATINLDYPVQVTQ
jgi:hypothetical protein